MSLEEDKRDFGEQTDIFAFWLDKERQQRYALRWLEFVWSIQATDQADQNREKWYLGRS